VAAGELAQGTSITSRAGPKLSVVSVSWQRQTPAELSAGSPGYTVYNFEVEKTHTFFVGVADGGTWVHNDCDWTLSEGKKLLRKWAKNAYDGKRKSSVRYHFEEHGDEVGADNVWDYLRQAKQVAQNLKGPGEPVDGPTPDVMGYKLSNGRYIHISPGGIISYGSRY
jgi:hypothetical protein